MPRPMSLLGPLMLLGLCQGQMLRGVITSSSWVPGADGEMHQEVHEYQTEFKRGSITVQETHTGNCANGLCRLKLRVPNPTTAIAGYVSRYVHGVFEKLRTAQSMTSVSVEERVSGQQASPPPPLVLTDARELPLATEVEPSLESEPVVLVQPVKLVGEVSQARADDSGLDEALKPFAGVAGLMLLSIYAGTLCGRCYRSRSQIRDLDLPLFPGQPVPLELLAPYPVRAAKVEEAAVLESCEEAAASRAYLLRVYERAAALA